MNSTLAQLLNNLSLKLNSHLNGNEQPAANVSAVNSVVNTSAANTSLPAGSEANSSGEKNSSIASFSTLQVELDKVRTKKHCGEGDLCFRRSLRLAPRHWQVLRTTLLSCRIKLRFAEFLCRPLLLHNADQTDRRLCPKSFPS